MSKKVLEVQMKSVIVNGFPTEETFKQFTEKGYKILQWDYANQYHPYAKASDTIVFFAKPINKEAYDKEMQSVKENGTCNDGQID